MANHTPKDMEKAAYAQAARPEERAHEKADVVVTPIDQKRQAKIDLRLDRTPKVYRKNYLKAVEGNSLRAAVNAQCLECVCWQREEVRLCTDLGCPLYPYRPYKEISKKGREGGDSAPESEISREGDPGIGLGQIRARRARGKGSSP